eukprot:10134799-Alexandrium_andersonii.AAC.1
MPRDKDSSLACEVRRGWGCWMHFVTAVVFRMVRCAQKRARACARGLRRARTSVLPSVLARRRACASVHVRASVWACWLAGVRVRGRAGAVRPCALGAPL